MNKKQIFLFILSALLGAVFIFSAYTKLEPISYFEFTIFSQLPVSQSLAAFMARFFIGLEAGIGLLLIANIFGSKKWVLYSSLLLLIAFTIHLVFLYFTVGNDVNCGCMGTLVKMSPLSSIVKNIVMMGVIVLLIKYRNNDHKKGYDWLALGMIVLLIVAPYFVFPMKDSYKQMSLDRMYNEEQPESPKKELRDGKNIVCFMSLTCGHCFDAAAEISKISKENPDLPFYFVFPMTVEDPDEITEKLFGFLNETNTANIPFSFITKETFVDLVHEAGASGTPVILWMNGNVIERKSTAAELDVKEIEMWRNSN